MPDDCPICGPCRRNKERPTCDVQRYQFTQLMLRDAVICNGCGQIIGAMEIMTWANPHELNKWGHPPSKETNE